MSDFYKDIEVALESINNNITALDNILTQKIFLGEKSPEVNSNYLTSSDEYFKSFSNLHSGMEKLIKAAQSTSFKDKITLKIGFFDKELKFIKAKRKDLLVKKDVLNYTYKRHYWCYTYRSDIYGTIIECLNACISTLYFSVYGKERGYTDPKIDMIINDYYQTYIDPRITINLFGKKKGELEKRLRAILIGDGYEEKIIKKNFQDEAPISTLIDIADKCYDTDWRYYDEMASANIKDISSQLKNIYTDIDLRAKNDPKRAKHILNHLKRFNQYVALLVMKMKEFYDADLKSYKIFITEVISVLKGLYEYDGD